MHTNTQHTHLLWVTPTNSSQVRHPPYKLANIYYTGILRGDLGVHIGVYQPCPDLKRTLVAMSDRTGMSISQVTDEVLYTGLIEMQELPEHEELGGRGSPPAPPINT